MLRPQFLIRTCPLERRALSERPRVLGHGEWIPGRPIDIATKLNAVYERLQVMATDPTLNFDDRHVDLAGFREIHLDLEVDVKPQQHV